MTTSTSVFVAEPGSIAAAGAGLCAIGRSNSTEFFLYYSIRDNPNLKPKSPSKPLKMDSYFSLRVSLLVINGERQKFNNFLLTPQQQKKPKILLVTFFLNFFFLIQEISLLYCRLYTLVIRICQPLLADLPLHRLRGPVRDHAPHQHLPLQRHDLLLHQDGGYREGAQHLRRLLRLRITVRVGGAQLF